jgi:hypothetical protein
MLKRADKVERRKGGQGGEEALPLLYFSAMQKHKMKKVFRMPQNFMFVYALTIY